MNINISETSLPILKKSLKADCPEIKPTLRTEALGRGLGFKSYASLQSQLKHGTFNAKADDITFKTYAGLAEESSFSRFALRPLSRSLARTLLWPVLDQNPDLNCNGFDSVWHGGDDFRRKPLAERKDIIKERRREAYYDAWPADQFELAMIYLEQQEQRKTINKNISSYGLKHGAENLSRELNLHSHLGDYVSNGMLIAAAYALGFQVKRISADSPNAWFNISEKPYQQSRGIAPSSYRSDPKLILAMYGAPDV